MVRASTVLVVFGLVLASLIAGCGEPGRTASAPASVSLEENVDVGSRRYAESAPAAAKYQMPMPPAPVPVASAAVPAETAAVDHRGVAFREWPSHPQVGSDPGLGDKYARVGENDFLRVQDAPLSTF